LREKEYPVGPGIVEVAQAARHINVLKELVQLPVEVDDEMYALVA
jgi:hypothetical protein